MVSVKPCRRGHTVGRFPNGNCKECSALHLKKWQQQNREKTRAHATKWQRQNREKYLAYQYAYRHGAVSEATVEKHLDSRIRELGGFTRKIIYPGRRGCPDRLVVLPTGRIFLVELKRQRTGRLSVHQIAEHEEFAKQGCTVAVLWSIEEVDTWVLTL